MTFLKSKIFKKDSLFNNTKRITLYNQTKSKFISQRNDWSENITLQSSKIFKSYKELKNIITKADYFRKVFKFAIVKE